MSQVLALPRYAGFKNQYNSKFLSYRAADKYLCFNGDDVSSQGSKFAIEQTSTGNGQVHIRCFYNNKYFVRNSSGFVVAEAAKPDADTSSDTCTLFEPIVVEDDDKQIIRFRHVQSGKYACLFNSPSSANHACLCARWTNPNGDMMDAYEVIDWDYLVIFPSYSIAFKGNNGKYLGVTATNCKLEFRENEKNAAMASFRVEPAGDGSVYIYSNYYKTYLCNTNYMITPSVSEKNPDNTGMLFQPFQIASKVIAFRSSDNCKFLNVNDGGFLVPKKITMTDDTHLTVEENFVSRSIYNIVYRQDDARIYNETPVTCGYGEDTNDSDQQDTMEIPIKYTETHVTGWNNSASIGVDVSTTIKVGIPLIAEGEIGIDVSANYEHQWGGSIEGSFENGVTYIATIGPRTHVKVSYVATKGTCDVPFSYTESVTYNDGTRKRYIMDDGVFTGVNCYNYSFVKKETPIE